MKTIILSAALVMSFTAAASDTYQCEMMWGEDVGTISLTGDPVNNVYSEITVNNEVKAFRHGVTERVYIYLYDNVVRGTKSYALEVVNIDDSTEAFQLSVYPKDQIVMGSHKIARYGCSK